MRYLVNRCRRAGRKCTEQRTPQHTRGAACLCGPGFSGSGEYRSGPGLSGYGLIGRGDSGRTALDHSAAVVTVACHGIDAAEFRLGAGHRIGKGVQCLSDHLSGAAARLVRERCQRGGRGDLDFVCPRT